MLTRCLEDTVEGQHEIIAFIGRPSMFFPIVITVVGCPLPFSIHVRFEGNAQLNIFSNLGFDFANTQSLHVAYLVSYYLLAVSLVDRNPHLKQPFDCKKICPRIDMYTRIARTIVWLSTNDTEEDKYIEVVIPMSIRNSNHGLRELFAEDCQTWLSQGLAKKDG